MDEPVVIILSNAYVLTKNEFKVLIYVHRYMVR